MKELKNDRYLRALLRQDSGHDPGMDDASGWPLSAGIKATRAVAGDLMSLCSQRRAGL